MDRTRFRAISLSESRKQSLQVVAIDALASGFLRWSPAFSIRRSVQGLIRLSTSYLFLEQIHLIRGLGILLQRCGWKPQPLKGILPQHCGWKPQPPEDILPHRCGWKPQPLKGAHDQYERI
jgi:hypothetical protein